MAKILVADDDAIITEELQDWLQAQNFTVEICSDGAEALARLEAFGYDLAILDWQMPALSGVEVCVKYRAMGGRTPILILTGKKETVDKESGLDSGADDYLTKPFELREFGARVRALLRRSAPYFAEKGTAGGISLDRATLTIIIEGTAVRLLPKEFSLLEFLMRHPNTFVPTEKILDYVWDCDSEASNQALRTCVNRLRKRIDQDGCPSIIESAKGYGYRLTQPGSSG